MTEIAYRVTRQSDLDHRLVEVAKEIKVLSALTVSEPVQSEFIDNWKRGDPRLPVLPQPETRFDQHESALQTIIAACDPLDPVDNYIAQTAQSYIEAIGLIHTAGTSAFLHHSFRLYGHPADPCANKSQTILQVADAFLDLIEPFVPANAYEPENHPVDSDTVVYALKKVAQEVFTDDPVEIVTDPALSSKAAAGASRIRIRAATGFSLHDLPQLVNHELLVHTLTALNGRRQPNLSSMGLGSPRTTETQEGIAVFAELVTRTMDLMRLRRIALRVRAIAMGLEGADFLDVFNFFLEAGYDPEESSHSAFRIFRGGDPTGRIVFTKDMVYLGGLLTLQDFLVQALKSGSHESVEMLFAGRLAFTDCQDLAEAYQTAFIAPPRYLPEWAKDFSTLAPQLIFSSLGQLVPFE